MVQVQAAAAVETVVQVELLELLVALELDMLEAQVELQILVAEAVLVLSEVMVLHLWQVLVE
tara:strand:+ start:174 stop:359 length:186 start_codon:yes stop_codon:yes gene_type:complete